MVTVPRGQPSDVAAAQGALAAYHGYLAAYATAGQTANPLDARLDVYTRGGALIQVRTSLRALALNGLVYRGGFQGEVQVTKVSLLTQRVFLLNCQDISGLTLVQKATGQPVATSQQNMRFPVVVEAQYFQGRWMIVQTTADRARRC